VYGTHASFAVAGLVSATYLVGSALTRPIYGRWMDRTDPARPLLISSTINVVIILGFAVAAHQDAPRVILLLLSAAIGASLPPTSTALRLQWPKLVPDHVGQAYALDSLVYELALVMAPALIGVLVGLTIPVAGLLAVAFSGAVGTAILLGGLDRGPETSHAEPSGAVDAVVHGRWVVIPIVAMGTFIACAEGSLTVLATGVAASHHQSSASGALLGSLSAGTLLGALLFGVVADRAVTRRVLVVCNTGLVTGFVLLALFGASLLGFMISAAIAGLTLSPCLTKVFITLRQSASPMTIAETLAWASLFASVGAAVGQAGAGALISASGLHVALAEPACAALLALCAASVANPSRITGTPARDTPSPV
jgi:MFS family permease